MHEGLPGPVSQHPVRGLQGLPTWNFCLQIFEMMEEDDDDELDMARLGLLKAQVELAVLAAQLWSTCYPHTLSTSGRTPYRFEFR